LLLPFEKYDFLRIIPFSSCNTIVFLFDRYKSLIAVKAERRGGKWGEALNATSGMPFEGQTRTARSLNQIRRFDRQAAAPPEL
jgi:hypothetical protein